MIVIVGCIVVIGAVLGGFSMAGGHVGALIHPSEFVTIGGAALGGLIVSSPKKVLIDLVKGVIASIKGSPFNKAAYEEAFKCMYDLLRTARRDGMLALEPLTAFHLRRSGAVDRCHGETGTNGRPARDGAQGAR
jgi:chemotaxis protein MotA